MHYSQKMFRCFTFIIKKRGKELNSLPLFYLIGVLSMFDI